GRDSRHGGKAGGTMKTISSIPAFYPLFTIGGQPQAVPCELRITEWEGRRYLCTPFACLNAYGGDDHKRQIEQGNYYATAAECEAYLAREYPNWQVAAPVMDALCDSIRWHGKMVGEWNVERKVG